MKGALVLGACLCVLWGCSPSGDGGGGVEVRIPLADFCAQWLNGLKQQQQRCGRGALKAEDAAALLELCEVYVVRGVERGVVQYDGVEATRCLLAQRQSCEDLFSACDVVRGTLAQGEACYNDLECAQGQCAQEDQCPGACAEVAPLGGSCEVLECDRDGVCTPDGFCARRGAQGEVCASSQDCAAGLACICEGDALCEVVEYDPPRSGRCAAQPPLAREGDPCPPGRFCADGLACITPFGARFGEPGICLPQTAPGERCVVGGEDLAWFYQGCRGGLCQSAEGDFEGLCVLSQEGGPCAQWAVRLEDGEPFTGQDCGQGLFCAEETGRCGGELSDGALPNLDCARP